MPPKKKVVKKPKKEAKDSTPAVPAPASEQSAPAAEPVAAPAVKPAPAAKPAPAPKATPAPAPVEPKAEPAADSEEEKGEKADEKADEKAEEKEPVAVDQKSQVPNVKPKADPKEVKRMEAMMGKLADNHAASIFVTAENGVTKAFEGADVAADGIDLKTVPTVFVKGCKDSKFTFNRRLTKMMIEGCENVEITVNKSILTNTIELWHCKNVTLHLNDEVRTLQFDMNENVIVNFARLASFGLLIWNKINGTKINFLDAKHHNFAAGFKEMLVKFPDSDETVDQFICRFIDDKILQERCIRLKNGHLSTEREAIDWDKRNETKKAEYMDSFLKEAGVHLNKDKLKEKIPANSPCPCKSGKKYKKCCSGKKAAGGTVKPLLYNEGKKK